MSEENEITEDVLREEMGLPRKATRNKDSENHPSITEKLALLHERASERRRQNRVDAEVQAIWNRVNSIPTVEQRLAEMRAAGTETSIRKRMHLPFRRRVD